MTPIQPSMYDTDAYHSLDSDSKEMLLSFSERHSGWYWHKGQWRQAIRTDEFLPEDPTIVLQACILLLSKWGKSVSACGLSVHGISRATIAFGDNSGPLAIEGTSPRHAAILLLAAVMRELREESQPLVRVLGNSESDPQLKKD